MNMFNATQLKKCLSAVTVMIFALFSVMQTPEAYACSIVEGAGTCEVDENGNIDIFLESEKGVAEGDFDVDLGNYLSANGSLDATDLLLRDISGDRTDILGDIFSTIETLVLVNKNGVFFADTAHIDVHSLIASTLDIQNELFMNDDFVFEKIEGLDPASIINESSNINLADGGFLVFISEAIENRGDIEAHLGEVHFAAGEKVTLNFDEQGLVNLVVDKGLTEVIKDSEGNVIIPINQIGNITAKKVTLSAKALSDVLDTLINNEGIIEASSAVEKDGVVHFVSNGAIENSGEIYADIFREEGYTFRTFGTLAGGVAYFNNIDGAANISGIIGSDISDTGDLNVVGDINLSNSVTFTTDSDQNGTGSFNMPSIHTIDGGGNNLTIKASEDSTLGSLRNINILSLEESQGGSNPTFTSDPTATVWDAGTITDFRAESVKVHRFTGAGTAGDPFLIHDVFGLQGAGDFLDKDYGLASDIDASSTSNWNAGLGFDPIGDLSNHFKGSFDGNNFNISNLSINRTVGLEGIGVGLFGVASDASFQDISLTNSNIAGSINVGSLDG